MARTGRLTRESSSAPPPPPVRTVLHLILPLSARTGPPELAEPQPHAAQPPGTRRPRFRLLKICSSRSTRSGLFTRSLDPIFLSSPTNDFSNISPLQFPRPAPRPSPSPLFSPRVSLCRPPARSSLPLRLGPSHLLPLSPSPFPCRCQQAFLDHLLNLTAPHLATKNPVGETCCFFPFKLLIMILLNCGQ